ncbi:hypothetical protein BC937DRAFT_87727 [Endogone sp. FLAS-F59071]|nr:hypothetical protein BC937DRAFT_87727 [Endogone sp. FLAS-F59071]|eukprot:RUS19282.1 hypothetical protein BC937DRAFT_87727 [Endogone sp. FLAS-F59071]
MGLKLSKSKATKYLVPVEDAPDVQHTVMRLLMHGNFQSPVEEALVAGIKVLDVGCGSGSWILEMARDYPNSTFIGTDTDTDAFPKHVERPPNCRFIKADTLGGLAFADGEFGFVHQRSISFHLFL